MTQKKHTQNEEMEFDYKDTVALKQFLTKFNRIVPRKYSGNSLKTQKKLAVAIKRARYMALLPYVVDPRHNTHYEYEKKENSLI